MSNQALYKLHFDCGRAGTIYGLFIAEVRKVNYLIKSGDELYFGECLGKYSDISGALQEEDISLVSQDENVLKLIKELDLESGYNPVEIYEENEREWPWEGDNE